MMKTLAGALLTGAVMGALFAGNAMAADMAVKAPMLMKAPAPVYSWTGCYVNAGGGYGLFDQETSEEFSGVEFGARWTTGGKGWFGTVGGGCDYQLSSSWVIGILGDYDFSDIKGTMFVEGDVGDESQKSAWAVGGRVGYLLTPTILGYVSGGYTQASFGQVDFVPLFGGPVEGSLSAHTYNGYFIGSGFDYNITFLPLPGLFLRSEYRYSSYEDDNVLFTDSSVDGLHSRKNVQTVRTSLIWRFGMH